MLTSFPPAQRCQQFDLHQQAHQWQSWHWKALSDQWKGHGGGERSHIAGGRPAQSHDIHGAHGQTIAPKYHAQIRVNCFLNYISLHGQWRADSNFSISSIHTHHSCPEKQAVIIIKFCSICMEHCT